MYHLLSKIFSSMNPFLNTKFAKFWNYLRNFFGISENHGEGRIDGGGRTNYYFDG
jgi:hypothetical protein